MKTQNKNGFSSIELFRFNENKYQEALLVDVAWIHEMPTFQMTEAPYMLDFYDLTLITGGHGTFYLDTQMYELKPNQLLFTSPKQVRRWYAKDVQGICLFFPASFFLSHLNDSMFLHNLHYFHTKVGPGDLVLQSDQFSYLLHKLEKMHTEVANLQTDSSQLLRANTTEILINTNRWYQKQHGQRQEKSTHIVISKFRQLIELHFDKHHRVIDYASMLAVTPGHLNVLCKMYLGCSASQLIMTRVFTEAKRQLIHSQISVEHLCFALGFKEPSYFCRAFKRETGTTPLQFRRSDKHYQGQI